MYVCVCRELTESVIASLIEKDPSISPYDVHEALDCCIGCGHCLPIIFDMIEEKEK